VATPGRGYFVGPMALPNTARLRYTAHMSSEDGSDGQDEGRRGTSNFVAKLLGTAAIATVLKRFATVDEDREIPRVVKGNPRAQMLAARTEELIDTGDTDDSIVAELVREARGRRSDLKTASAWARQDGRWTELERPDHIVRVLNAAATNQAVAPPLPRHAQRFVELGRFAALPQDVAFRELKELVPELAEMEATIHAAAERDRANGIGAAAGFDEWRSMRTRLHSIVGPQAHGEGTLIRSSVARDVAWVQLAEAAHLT
jgi:hypothetical protein